MELTSDEKIDKLRKAQDKLFDVIELAEEVFPDDGNIQAYFIDHLKIRVSDDHGFLNSDLNFDKLIEQVEQCISEQITQYPQTIFAKLAHNRFGIILPENVAQSLIIAEQLACSLDKKSSRLKVQVTILNCI